MNFEKRIEELYIELPDLQESADPFLPGILVDKLFFVSGQLPYVSGKLEFKGRVGIEVSPDQGSLAARHALLRNLSVLKQGLGSLNKVNKIVQLTCFIACGGDFQNLNRVLDPSSKLLEDIFGSNGKHSRIVAGVNRLPEGACVELSLIAGV